MSICSGCGGVVGRDCYDPVMCEMIAIDMQHRHDAETALTESEAATLAGLRDGSLVAVPRAVGIDFGASPSRTIVTRTVWKDGRLQQTEIPMEEFLAAAQEPGHE